MKTRTFLIKDIDCKMIVEETTRKEVLSWMDEYIENMQYDWFDGTDSSFGILYDDGTTDSVMDGFYDGHKIRRTHISAIVYTNPCTDMVFGNYEINEYGVVSPSFNISIDSNIVEQ